MPEDIMAAHITSEEFLEYCDEALGEEAAERLELHVAECDECARWARESWQRLELLEHWTARAHGEAAAAAAVRRGLVEALQQNRPVAPNWKARLERWLAASGELARAGVEALGRAAAPLAGAPGEGFAGGWQPAFGGVRGPAETMPKQPERMVAVVRGGLPAEAIARVAVDDQRETVEIRVDRFPLNQPAPLVMLASQGPRGGTQIQPLERSPEGDYLLAGFEGVPPGVCVVYFEPSVGT